MKAVFFDLDGTLLDTLEDLFLSVNHTMSVMSFPHRSREEVRRFLGNGAAHLIGKSLSQENLNRLDEALDIFQEHYKIHAQDHTRPYPGILELLSKLSEQNFALGIISNKPDYAVQILAKTHFPNLPYSTGEKEGIQRKPAPDMLFLAMRELGIEKENCLYVGDSEVDIETAKNAGIECIAVTWGFRDEDVLRTAGAVHFAHNTNELYQKINDLI